MVYDGFGPADLRQACAELSLWDHGALASRQLGGTRLSLGTGEQSRPLRGAKLGGSGCLGTMHNLGPESCSWDPRSPR